ncbi:YusW family protein [Solibacillus sp. FSL K6-1523]|uniref:YusW family protein n=1 Tax=Solibacillus sp. FSL K6-1523 TaxID=2921471 RepID=UPI0030F597E8
MKRNLLFALPLSLLLLGACNNDKETKVTTTEPVNTNTQTEANTNTIANEGAFNFNSFSLDVDYGINDSFEVDYELERDGVEASIEDRNNKVIKGNDAYTKLEPIFKSFQFTSTSTDQEIISEVLKAFDLDENYQEIEVEIHFSDGVKKEFKSKK